MTQIAKYISFEGKRLKTYWLRGEYCVIDRDLAEFFGIPKSRLLSVASRNKQRLSELDRYIINEIECARIKKHDNSLLFDSKHKIHAFNLKAIGTVAFQLRNNPVADRLSVFIIRDVVNSGKINVFELLTK